MRILILLNLIWFCFCVCNIDTNNSNSIDITGQAIPGLTWDLWQSKEIYNCFFDHTTDTQPNLEDSSWDCYLSPAMPFNVLYFSNGIS